MYNRWPLLKLSGFLSYSPTSTGRGKHVNTIKTNVFSQLVTPLVFEIIFFLSFESFFMSTQTFKPLLKPIFCHIF